MKKIASKAGKLLGSLIYMIIYFSPIFGSTITIIESRSPGSPPGVPNWSELFVMLCRYAIFAITVYYLIK